MNRLPVKITTLCFLIYYLLYLGLKSPITTRWVDFPVYWEAGLKAVRGQTVYDVVGHFQYKYSPFVALGFGTFFTHFDFESASWTFRSMCMALWLIWATFCIYNLGFSRAKSTLAIQINEVSVENNFFWIAPICAALFLGALRLDLELGQMNVVCAVFVTSAFALLSARDRIDSGSTRFYRYELLAALFLAGAVQMKLFCLVFFPYLVFRREWRVVWATGAAIIALSLGGLVAQRGWDAALLENEKWLRTLFASTRDLVPHETNVSLFGWATRVGGEVFARVLWVLFFAAFLSLSFAGRRADPLRMSAVLALGVVFLIPLVWSYWILFLLPLVALHFGRRIARGEGALRWMDVPWLIVVLAFQGQHSHLNMRYGFFPALVLFLFLIRGTLYDVFRSADCFAPSRSR